MPPPAYYAIANKCVGRVVCRFRAAGHLTAIVYCGRCAAAPPRVPRSSIAVPLVRNACEMTQSLFKKETPATCPTAFKEKGSDLSKLT